MVDKNESRKEFETLEEEVVIQDLWFEESQDGSTINKLFIELEDGRRVSCKMVKTVTEEVKRDGITFKKHLKVPYGIAEIPEKIKEVVVRKPCRVRIKFKKWDKGDKVYYFIQTPKWIDEWLIVGEVSAASESSVEVVKVK